MPVENHKKAGPSGYRIKVTRNGPYVVHGGVPLARQIIVSDAHGDPLKWCSAESLPAEETYVLCRCGQSKKWPFCDGTHASVHFDGTETAGDEPYLAEPKVTAGPALCLTDVGALCSHAAFCDRAGGTWYLIEHSDDPAARQAAIEEATNCPSGRLTAWEKEGQAIEPVLEASIGVIEDPLQGTKGPFWVRGGIPIEAGDGKVYHVRNRVTLCGCGKSGNKPFCDGSHIRK